MLQSDKVLMLCLTIATMVAAYEIHSSRLQIYELDTFKVTHASKYPGPVLSIGLSPDCSLLAVGQADGLLSIRKHSRPKAIPVEAGE